MNGVSSFAACGLNTASMTTSAERSCIENCWIAGGSRKWRLWCVLCRWVWVCLRTMSIVDGDLREDAGGDGGRVGRRWCSYDL